MSSVDVSWLIGGGALCLIGVHLGNSLQAYGSKLAAPDHSFAHLVSTSPAYPVTWCLSKLIDLCVSAITWGLVSWGLANGKGDASLLVGTTQFSLLDLRSSSGGYALCFYTFTLVTASLGVFSECVSDFSTRYVKLVYRIMSLAFCLIVYPFIFHWAWSDRGWASPFRSSSKASLLAGCGVMDTAGSSVIHLSAGVAASVVLLFMDRTPLPFPQKTDGAGEGGGVTRYLQPAKTENVGALLHFLGLLLLWGGAYGLHAINNLPLRDSGIVAGKRVAMTTVGTISASIAGFVVSLFWGESWNGIQTKLTSQLITARDAILVGRCALTGLVAMGACCSSCEFEGALTIGIVAALLQIFLHKLFQIVDFDDSSGAVGVHVVGGVWGLLAAGLLTSQVGYKSTIEEFYLSGENRAFYCNGVWYGGSGNQLAANIVFILATIAWSFSVMLVVLLPLRWLLPSEFKENQQILVLLKNAFSHDQDLEKNLQLAKQSNARAERERAVHAHHDGSLQLSTLAIAPTKNDSTSGQNLFPTPSSQEVPLPVGKEDDYDDEAFERANGYSWDVVVVFKAPKPQADGKRKKVMTFEKSKDTMSENGKRPAEIITLLNLAGLQTRVFHSKDKSRIFCKLRAPLQLLRASADLSDVKLLLNSDVLKVAAESGWEGTRDGKKIKIAPFFISEGKSEHLTSYSPYDYIYSQFDEVEEDDTTSGNIQSLRYPESEKAITPWPSLYATSSNLKHAVKHGFTACERIKLIQGILTHEGEKGCGLDFQELLNSTPGKPSRVLGWYALHDEEDIERLRKEWLGWNIMPWKSPSNDIREYFGEKIALYFHFLSHYCTSLGGISVVGVAVIIHLIVISVENNSFFGSLRFMYSLPPYCLLVTLWASWFLETWLQKEKTVALKWGMIGFEATEGERPQFKGRLINSWVDGSYPTKAFDRNKKRMRLQLSFSSLSTVTCVVVGVFASTFFFKFWLKSHNQSEYSVFADIINAISIMILDILYKKFAVYMTNFENNRTDTEYEDSIILKLFLFGFFNAYCPSIYIAFIKQWIGDPCTQDSCMGELGQTMMIVFVVRLVTGVSIKTALPRISRWALRSREANDLIAARKSGKGESRSAVKTATEEQCDLEEYVDVFDDYNELSVQFGYICLFAPAFPLAPLLSLMSNFCEIRADGFKVLKMMRRAWPRSAEDIGTWYTIFNTISVLSIFSNAGLIFYTMDIMDGATDITRLGYFFLYIIVTLFIRQIFGRLVDKYPEEIDIQLARQEFLVSKIIKKVPDEDHSVDVERFRSHRSYSSKVAIDILRTDDNEHRIKTFKLDTRIKELNGKWWGCGE